MKVLVACEESQTVCKAFRERGHEAYSCDIQEPSGGHPEWHVLGDALEALKGGTITTMDGMSHDVGKWDLLIAHPPCTYLSNAGARHLWKNHQLQADRVMLGIQARDFFMAFYNADIPRICVENPIPSKVFAMPPYMQTVQPYEFGHPYTKKTCLWLKETSGKGKRVLTGVRWAESNNRSNNQGIATVPIRTTKEAPEGLTKTSKGGIILNNDNDEARRMLETCYAKQKMMVNPIIDWTDENVWEFIHSRNIPYCELYDQGWKRLGCIGCPVAGKHREKELEAYPRYKKLWLKAFADLQAERLKCGKEPLKSPDGRVYDAEGLCGWWMQSKEVYGQCDLFAEMEGET